MIILRIIKTTLFVGASLILHYNGITVSTVGFWMMVLVLICTNFISLIEGENE